MRISERRFEAGETIYARGEPDRYLYFLAQGVIKLYKPYAGHKEALVTLLKEGNVFGEPSPRARGTHCDSSEAATACRVAAVGKAALEHHLRRDPRCALALLVAYSLWAQRSERAIARLLSREICPRLAATLLELADGFGETEEGEVAIGVRLSHGMLADMIASSRSPVSKEMSHLRSEGLIESHREGRIVLLDKQRLVELAQRGHHS